MYLVSIYVTQIKHARFFLLLANDDNRIFPGENTRTWSERFSFSFI